MQHNFLMTFYVSSRGGQTPLKKWMGGHGQIRPVGSASGHVKGKRSRGKQRKIWRTMRPEGEKHRPDQDWQGDQKQRGLERSCKSLIVSLLMEERKEEENVISNLQRNSGKNTRFI